MNNYITNIIRIFPVSIHQKKSIIIILLILIISSAISIYSLIFFLLNKVFLIGSDAFYYMSIGDSILHNGEVRNITSIPAKAVKTPQNGAAFIHVILSILGIGARGRIISMVFINYLFYLSAIYPLYKIAFLSGLKRGLPLVALLAVYLGPWHIYRINLLAINDGIFNTLTLWLVYIIIKFIRDMDAIGSISLNTFPIKKMVIMSLLVIVLILFRLNAMLIMVSAVISALLVRNYKSIILLIVPCMFLLLVFLSIYFFVDVSGFESGVLPRFINMFWAVKVVNIKIQLWKILPRLVAGLSGLTNPLATLFFTIFPLSMMYYGIHGIIEKNFHKVFIATICLTGLWFTMTFQNARVIWYTFPFIYLILLNLKKIRFIGYAFILLVFVQSLHQFYTGFRKGPGSLFWLYIYENSIALSQDDNLLVARSGRHPYFFLNTRTYDTTPGNNQIIIPKELNWDLIENRGSIYIVGDSIYIASVSPQIYEMASTNSYELESTPLTPDLDEFEGWALVEFQITEDDPL